MPWSCVDLRYAREKPTWLALQGLPSTTAVVDRRAFLDETLPGAMQAEDDVLVFFIDRDEALEGSADSFADGGGVRGIALAALAGHALGYLPVQLSTQGIDPQITRDCLEALRGLSGVRVTFPQYDPGPGQRRWELVAAGSVFLAVSIYFIYTMLRSYLQGYGIGVGFVIPAAMALVAAWIVRYGWKRRC